MDGGALEIPALLAAAGAGDAAATSAPITMQGILGALGVGGSAGPYGFGVGIAPSGAGAGIGSAALPASEAVGISGAPTGAGAVPGSLGGLLGASEATGVSGAPFGTGIGAMPPGPPGLLDQLRGMLNSPGVSRVGQGLENMNKLRVAGQMTGIGQPPPRPPAAPVPPPAGGPPTLASQIFARTAPHGGMGLGGVGTGAISPQVLMMLLQKMQQQGGM